MNKSDFDFYLPERLIAQTPLEKRDSSRLLHLDKKTGAIEHGHFHDITKYLKKGDCLVMNDSRVLPARLIGSRLSGGLVELVLLRDLGDGCWECLSRPGRKTKPGTELTFGDGELTATVMDVAEGGNRIVKFHFEGIFIEKLEKLGKMPLPPYIKEELQDSERYQTVYSRELGSAAAPTAGLHFTKELLKEIEDMGVKTCFVTLHVGLGTFRPVKAEKIEEHEMQILLTKPRKTAAELLLSEQLHAARSKALQKQTEQWRQAQGGQTFLSIRAIRSNASTRL